MKLQGFAERLAYARMLVHFRLGRCVTHTDIAKAVKRTQPWVTKWAKSPTPPKDYEVHRPLADFLDVDVDWLIRNEGSPPDPELWDRWVSAQAVRPVRRAQNVAPEAAESSRGAGKRARSR